MTNHIEALAAQIVADHKNGDVDVEEIVFGKLRICDLPHLAGLLKGHGSSNELNTADYAMRAINQALA
jgi:hypothetical protein